MFDYLDTLGAVLDFIDEFENDTLSVFFKKTRKSGKFYSVFPRYIHYWQPLQDIVSICDILGIENLQKNKQNLLYCLNLLRNTQLNQSKKFFKSRLELMKGYFQEAEGEIDRKIALLEENEWFRLNEALNCYVQELNCSAIAMSVSAVESRLYSLMKSENPSEEPNLKTLTLGQLIKEYVENKERYGSVVLEKHLPLLNYCNVYRILSVHPKKDKVTRANATAIMSMTFSFLFDKEQKAKIYKEK
jgi:hypothetical protein